MRRAISIVLVVAIALQTVGCSTWKPLTREGEVPEDDKQSSVRDLVLGRLKEGMRVRIRIREGVRAPIKGQTIEGRMDKVGLNALTLTPFNSYAPGNVSKELTLPYADIASIEYVETHRISRVFVAGLAVGVILGYYFLFSVQISGEEASE